MSSHTSLVTRLIGAELSVATFVRDYVQFSFEDASGTHVLSAYEDPVIVDGSGTVRRGDARWESALVALIDKTVRRAEVDDRAITIHLDGATLSIGLQGEYVEAAMLHVAPDAWEAWRPGDIGRR